MNLPTNFVKNVRQAFGQSGERFLTDLPHLISEASRRWDLVIGEPYPLSYHYVCAVRRRDGTPAVLKIGLPDRELTSEINTLGLYLGQGACRLYDADPGAGMLLLECLAPGTMLASLEDDDQAIRIVAEVLCAIQHPAPEGDGFLTLRG
jgi:streptomycin 6-kinase